MTHRDGEFTGELLGMPRCCRATVMRRVRTTDCLPYAPSSLNQYPGYSSNLDGKRRNANNKFFEDYATSIMCGPGRGVVCWCALLGVGRIRKVLGSRRLRRLQSYHSLLTLEPAKTRHPHALSRGKPSIREPNIQTSS